VLDDGGISGPGPARLKGQGTSEGILQPQHRTAQIGKALFGMEAYTKSNRRSHTKARAFLTHREVLESYFAHAVDAKFSCANTAV
jgi:hypothetical protein